MIFAFASNRKNHQTCWTSAARTRRSSFARGAASRTALWPCSARSTTGQRAGWADVALLEGDCASYSLMQRGALRRKKCYWHLLFCADFTMSAPLGSQFGASLSRRSLSSPNYTLIITNFGRFWGLNFVRRQGVATGGMNHFRRLSQYRSLRPYQWLPRCGLNWDA